MKNYYWDSTPNPGVTGFWCFNCHKNHAINISVYVQYQCFRYAVTWENDNQRSKIPPLNETDVQLALIDLFLIILIVFMICIVKDDTLFRVWVLVTLWWKLISGPKIAQGVKLQTLLLMWKISPEGLINIELQGCS